jgi:hypothetical protein
MQQISHTTPASNIKYCGSCEKPNASKLCGKCKQVAYCDRDCQLAHWTAHKALCSAPWYANAKLWDQKVVDVRFGCVRRAKNFIAQALKLIPKSGELKYLIISKKPNENDATLSYEGSRDIGWEYHVVVEYSEGNNRFIIEPLKSKKLFEYKAWAAEITQGNSDKFKCLSMNQIYGAAIDGQTRKVLGVFAEANGKILKIDQDL